LPISEIGNYFLTNPIGLLIYQQANSYRQARAREIIAGMSRSVKRISETIQSKFRIWHISL
jgi:hypothetical protein